MPRNIVLFSDGTGNSASNVFKTNVRRLYDALDVTDPIPPAVPRQFAFYDDGVGTSSFRPLAVLGGVFGYGLARNVRSIYAFLCRTYQPGDQIYGFGFSRGAFTIRLVAGFILDQGLVPYDGDEAKLSRDVADAYRAYRGKFQTPTAAASGTASTSKKRYPAIALRGLRDGVLRQWRRLRRHQLYNKHANRTLDKIKMLGVWDTVDAYGLPIEELTRAVDRYVWPLSFPTAVLNARVERAYQALCLDDERATFFPRLWHEAVPEDATRITQVWFAGVHADVGGGYADNSLAHVSLNWMADQASANGLRFSQAIRAHQKALADDNGPKHDSRRGFASYYRYQPRDLRALTCQTPIPGFRPEVKVSRTKIHESVFSRIRDGQDGYAPIGLPKSFDVVGKIDGRDFVEDGNAFLWKDASPEQRADLWRRFDGEQDRIWNLVWQRRLAYFVTLTGTLGLFATPLVLTVHGCSSPACVVSPLVVGAGYLLPGFAATWVAVLATNPVAAIILTAVVVLGLVWGGRLQTQIFDEMRHLWYRLAPAWAPPVASPPGRRPSSPGPVERLIKRLRRQSDGKLQEQLRWGLLPVLVLVATGYLAAGLVNNALLSGREAAGWSCKAASSTRMSINERITAPDFDTRSPCHPLGIIAEQGAIYRLTVTTRPRTTPASVQDAGHRGWHDRTTPASPNGILAEGFMPTLLTTIGVPFRRHLTQPWFQLMVRIGDKGSDTYAPEWRLIASQPTGDTYQANLVARSTGPMFIYVNDAMLVACSSCFFYSNNDGLGHIELWLRGLQQPSSGDAADQS